MSRLSPWVYGLPDFGPGNGWPHPVPVTRLAGARCLARDGRGQCGSRKTATFLFIEPRPMFVSLCDRHLHHLSEVGEETMPWTDYGDNDNEESEAA